MKSTSRQQDTLSREIYKWIQSLDLVYPIRNVRRDFSNGFLIAQIFSCYFPDVFLMHSFDPGSSVEKKKSNWQQICLLFRKIRFPLQNELSVIRGLIECDNDITVSFINEIYTFLTTRSIQTKVVPKVMKPKSRRIPVSAPESKVASPRSLIEQKEEASTISKLDTSSTVSSARPSKLLKGKTRQLGENISVMGEIKTGGVTIKDMSANIMNLRTEKLGINPSVSPRSPPKEEKSEAPGNNLLGRTPMKVLETIIRETLGSSLPQASAALPIFMSSLDETNPSGEISDREIRAVIKTLCENSDQFTQNCNSHKTELMKLLPLLSHVFVSREYECSKNAGRLLVEVGRVMTENNPLIASNFFFDFCFPKIQSKFLGNEVKSRELSLAIFESFCPFDCFTVHTQGLQLLSRRLNNHRAFLCCIADLLRLLDDRNLSTVPRILTEVYVDAAGKGATDMMPSARKHATWIIRRIVDDFCADIESKNHMDHLVQMIEKLLTRIQLLACDPCGEVRCLTVSTAGQVLRSGISSNVAHSIIENALTFDKPVSQQACCAIAMETAVLLRQLPDLIQDWIQFLVQLEPQNRHMILGITHTDISNASDNWNSSDMIDAVRHIVENLGTKQPLPTTVIDIIHALALHEASGNELGAIWDSLAPAMIRSLELCVEDADVAASCVDILNCLCNICSSNIFLHPLWSKYLFSIFSKSRIRNYESEPVYVLVRGLHEIVYNTDQDTRASFHVMLEQTIREYPDLQKNPYVLALQQ